MAARGWTVQSNGWASGYVLKGHDVTQAEHRAFNDNAELKPAKMVRKDMLFTDDVFEDSV